MDQDLGVLLPSTPIFSGFLHLLALRVMAVVVDVSPRCKFIISDCIIALHGGVRELTMCVSLFRQLPRVTSEAIQTLTPEIDRCISAELRPRSTRYAHCSEMQFICVPPAAYLAGYLTDHLLHFCDPRRKSISKPTRRRRKPWYNGWGRPGIPDPLSIPLRALGASDVQRPSLISFDSCCCTVTLGRRQVALPGQQERVSALLWRVREKAETTSRSSRSSKSRCRLHSQELPMKPL